jgi:hypothetical protein
MDARARAKTHPLTKFGILNMVQCCAEMTPSAPIATAWRHRSIRHPRGRAGLLLVQQSRCLLLEPREVRSGLRAVGTVILHNTFLQYVENHDN